MKIVSYENQLNSIKKSTKRSEEEKKIAQNWIVSF